MADSLQDSRPVTTDVFRWENGMFNSYGPMEVLWNMQEIFFIDVLQSLKISTCGWELKLLCKILVNVHQTPDLRRKLGFCHKQLEAKWSSTHNSSLLSHGVNKYIHHQV
jgi:hypothetical protein